MLGATLGAFFLFNFLLRHTPSSPAGVCWFAFTKKRKEKIEQQLAQEPCRLLWEYPPCALRGDLCGDLWLAQVELQAAPGVSRQDGCGICSVCPSPPFPSQRLITNRNLLPVSRKLSWGSLSPRTIVRAKEELIMFCQNRVGEC